MNSIAINRNFKDIDKIKMMFEELFPEEERVPMEQLLDLSENPQCRFLAYYDNGELVGMTLSFSDEKTAFLLYLCVNSRIQSRGYGGKILEHLKSGYKGKSFFLNVEPPDKDAANYSQRIKRLEFYSRHGFNLTDYNISFAGKGSYAIVGLDDSKIDDYKKFFSAIASAAGKKCEITKSR